MRQFEFTQKLSLLAHKGIDDNVNYNRRRTARKKDRLSKSTVGEVHIIPTSIQLKLFEL